MVAAPLITIGLLKVRPSALACKMVEAAMVSVLEVLPKAEALPTFNIPLFKAMLVLTLLTWSSKNTLELPPDKVSVETLMALVCVSVAVSVIVKPAPVKPSTPDKVPMAKLVAV